MGGDKTGWYARKRSQKAAGVSAPPTVLSTMTASESNPEKGQESTGSSTSRRVFLGAAAALVGLTSSGTATADGQLGERQAVADDGRLEIGGVVGESMAVCDGAAVGLKQLNDDAVSIDIRSDDGLSTTRVILSLEEAEALCDRLRTQVEEAHDA